MPYDLESRLTAIGRWQYLNLATAAGVAVLLFIHLF